MRSMKATLLLWYFIIQLIIYPSLLGILYYKAHKTFYEQLDERLEEIAEQIQCDVKVGMDGKIQVAESPLIKELISEQDEGVSLVDLTTGETVVSSPLFQHKAFNLPGKIERRLKSRNEYFWNMRIGDQLVRIIAIKWQLPEVTPAREAQLLVALNCKEVIYRLKGLLQYATRLLVLALVLTLFTALLISNQTLRPLKTLSQQLDQITAQHLAFRFTPPRHSELKPLTEAINSLLERIEQAFNRERQLTADIAHELRTPIAGLRSMIEVALRKPRAEAEYRQTLEEAKIVLAQTQQLIENLLMLAQLEGGQVSVKEEVVPLRDIIDIAWSLITEKAEEKKLQLANLVPAELLIITDKNKFQIIVNNILHNAVEYAKTSSEVTASVEIDKQRGTAELSIINKGELIPAEHLPHLFERFWRGDAARSETGSHYGLGLAIVQALAQLLSISVQPLNLPPEEVCFRISNLRLHSRE